MASTRTVTVYSWLAAAAHRSNEPITNTVLCRAVREHLDVDGASVTLMACLDGDDSGRSAGEVRQEPVATTGSTSTRLEELHLTAGEGPSTAAFVHAAPILIPDLLAALSRWPGFVPAALDHGVAAVFAFPLHTASGQIGALTAHRARSGGLAPWAVADAPVFAELAAHLLRLDPALTAESRPAGGPVGLRDEVHQAVGVLAVQLGVGMQQAFARLRAHAIAHDMPLSEVADEVVTHRLHLPDDASPRT